MSGETQSEQGNAVAVERPSGWFNFNEKPVMLQFREPYIGVDYPAYRPTVKDGGVVAAPVLNGILHVEPDGSGGVMLILERPTGHGGDTLLMAVKPADVVFCTHINESRIVTQ
jgi:hypothetical protein